jgi:hypothetical protein
VSRTWLFLTIPGALASLALLSWTAMSLLRTVRGSVVASVPVVAEQTVAINSSGDLAINIETPLLAHRPAQLLLSLYAANSDTRIALSPIAMQTKVSSMSRTRIELYSLTLPSAGTYVLRIEGLNPSTDYSADAVLITRPYHGALVLHVLALIFLGVALIGSLVVSGLVISGKSFTPSASTSQT